MAGCRSLGFGMLPGDGPAPLRGPLAPFSHLRVYLSIGQCHPPPVLRDRWAVSAGERIFRIGSTPRNPAISNQPGGESEASRSSVGSGAESSSRRPSRPKSTASVDEPMPWVLPPLSTMISERQAIGANPAGTRFSIGCRPRVRRWNHVVSTTWGMRYRRWLPWLPPG